MKETLYLIGIQIIEFIWIIYYLSRIASYLKPPEPVDFAKFDKLERLADPHEPVEFYNSGLSAQSVMRVWHDGKCQLFGSQDTLQNNRTDIPIEEFEGEENTLTKLEQMGFTGITDYIWITNPPFER
jgi:hypothetical protein